jgi:hypothetical protein
MTFELEDVEIPPGDMDGDVVDRRGADRALEAAAVGMPVEDDVGPVLRDRRREPVAAEIRPDPLRLAVQRVGGRGVVQQHDADGTVRDRLQPLSDRVGLRARLRVHAPQQGLAEVGKRRAGEPADEPLRADDADLAAVELERGGRAVEHVHTGVAQHGRDLVAASGVEIVVAEHRAHGHAHARARLGEHLRLLRLPERRQVTGEQDEVDAFLQLGERLLEPVSRRFRRVDVACSCDRDHRSHVPRRARPGNRPR